MSDERREVASADETAALIERMAAAIWAGRRPGSPFYLVGVRTRGATLAERLGQELSHIGGDTIAVGAVDITLYRDDLGEGRAGRSSAGPRSPSPWMMPRLSWSTTSFSPAGRSGLR